jgi:hypothetical protein
MKESHVTYVNLYSHWTAQMRTSCYSYHLAHADWLAFLNMAALEQVYPPCSRRLSSEY